MCSATWLNASSTLRRIRWILGGVPFLLLLLMAPAPASAQLYSGSLTGIVSDPSGAVIPDAQVTLTDTGKGFDYKAKTNSVGRYLLRSLPPSTYRLTVVSKGFAPFTQDHIVLDVDQNATIDVTLQLSGTTQAVEVTGKAPLLQAQDATTGQEINRTFINDLPLIGRGVTDLTFLAPGVNPAPGWTFGSINGLYDTNNFTSNGGRNATSDMLVDGVSTSGYNSNTAIQYPLYMPSVDAVQEFKVQQNNFSAEIGYSSNTVVNVVTRSGTNQFHGSAYEFVRNQVFDANSWFNNAGGIPMQPLRYNDFGATAGGPIKKDKMFFFADYEGSRIHTMSSGFHAGVPSQAERQGDFGELCGYAGGTFDSNGMCNAQGGAGQLWDPYSGVYSPDAGGAVRSLFIPYNNMATYQSPGNTNLNGTVMQLAARPGNLIDPAASKIMSYFPLPNLNVGNASYSPYDNWTSNGIAIANHNQFDTRIDRRIGDRDQLTGRFSYASSPSTGGTACFPNPMDPCSSGATSWQQRDIALNEVHTFSPTTVLTLSYGFARQFVNQPGPAASYPNFNPITDLGLPSYMADSGVKATPVIVLYGGYYQAGPLNATGGQPWAILKNAEETHHLIGALDHMQGRHEFKFGGEMRVHHVNQGQPGTPEGYFTFDYNTTSQGPNYGGGDAMAGLLTGTSTTGWGQYEIPPYLAEQNIGYAWYFQDNYRVSDKLTLNLGARYELEFPRTVRHNEQAWFDPTLASPLGDVPGLGPIKGGLVYASNAQRHVVNTNYNGIAPRIGLAYRVTPKLVLRSGYGIFYNPSEFVTSSASGTGGEDGYDATTNWTSTYQGDGATPWGRLSNPFPDGLVMPTGSSLGAMTNVGTGISEFVRNLIALPYTQTWNAGFQYELRGGFLVDANYIGTKGTHLYFAGANALNYLGPWIEQATPSQIADLESYVPNPFYGHITNDTYPLSYPTVQAMQLLYQYPQYTSVSMQFPPWANSIYNAFQLRVEKRLSKGLQLLVNYTNAKSIDDASVGANTTWLGGFISQIDPNNRKLERSVSEYDIPQVLNIAYTYQLPFGQGKHWGASWNRWVDGVLGGWQTNGMWRFDNGQPLALWESGGGLTLPGYGERPNLIGKLQVNPRSKWFCSGPGCGYFANQGSTTEPTDVAVVNGDYTLGTAPRELPNLRAPGTNTGALSLFKEFNLSKLREGSRAEFRLESFNALNHPQFCGPNMGVNGGSFGQITCQANSPREVQLALKLYW